jgi:excisionase family DNA binding protein
MEKGCLTASEVCRYLGWSRMTLSRKLAAGVFRGVAFRPVDCDWRFDRAAFEALIEKWKQEAA